MPRPSRDAAFSDVAGTLLMVGAVVLAGGTVTAVVAVNLSQPGLPPASIQLEPLSPGDVLLNLTLRQGEAIPLDDLALSLARNGSAPAAVPRATWTTPDPSAWRAGDTLAFAIGPTTAGETMVVVAIRPSAQAQVASLSASTRGAPAPDPVVGASLVLVAPPARLVADGASTTLLAVRVSHPGGAGLVADVQANLTLLANASATANGTLALGDRGRDGDVVGGDGVWSALLRAPATTRPGVYNLSLAAIDVAGRVAGTLSVPVNITANLTTLVAGGSGNGTGGGSVEGGTCFNCTMGDRVIEGTMLDIPSSSNITRLRFRDWVWDTKHPTRATGDEVLVMVTTPDNNFWSVYLQFENDNGHPAIKRMITWNRFNETEYEPRNGSSLRLANLDFNLLDPVAEQQMRVKNGSPHPTALYRAAGLGSPARLNVHVLADFSHSATEQGVLAFDVVTGP